MSDAPEDPDLLAAEYVLGALDAAEREAAAARMEHDGAFAARVAVWQNRLSPLARLVDPVPPPVGLWDRIAASTGGAPVSEAEPGAASPGRFVLLWRNVNLWRGASVVGFALAASLAVLMLTSRPPTVVATLLPPDSNGAIIVQRPSPGHLRLLASGALGFDSTHDLEIWVLPSGATRPVSLGLMSEGGRSVTQSWQGPAQLMISREPLGGSPTGLPTGPVIFKGSLSG